MSDVPETFKKLWSRNEDGTVWSAKFDGYLLTTVKQVGERWFCEEASDLPFLDATSAMVFASKELLDRMNKLWPDDVKKAKGL